MPRSAKAKHPLETTSGRDLAVHDGRELVGFVRRIGTIFAAYTAGGKFLGRFDDQISAMRAIPSRRGGA
jgi:hypothetical protein